MFPNRRFAHRSSVVVLLLALVVGSLLPVSRATGADEKARQQARAITSGQRVFSCGHSFHVFVPGILSDMAKAAGIKGHQIVGVSGIGGSRVIQHWDVPEAKNKGSTGSRMRGG
jgi:hypothetical protein